MRELHALNSCIKYYILLFSFFHSPSFSQFMCFNIVFYVCAKHLYLKFRALSTSINWHCQKNIVCFFPLAERWAHRNRHAIGDNNVFFCSENQFIACNNMKYCSISSLDYKNYCYEFSFDHRMNNFSLSTLIRFPTTFCLSHAWNALLPFDEHTEISMF